MDFEGGMDAMINGTLEPYFESFYQFADWYFCGLGEPYPTHQKTTHSFPDTSASSQSLEHEKTPNIQHYHDYTEFREQGLKKQASKAVRSFIDSFATSDQITKWVWENLPTLEKNLHARLRHELFAELVYPVLKAGYLSNDLQSTLWLGKLIQNLIQSESLWRELNWINEIDLYKKCLEIDPDHYESRRCLILALLNWLHQTEHHWPSGILYGMNGATLSQCEVIREEVELLFRLDLEQQHTAYLSQYLEKLETYRARLLNRENSD